MSSVAVDNGDSGFVVMELVVFVLLVLVFVVAVKLLFVVVTDDESDCGDCAENGIVGVFDWIGVNGS